ncbi:MAG: class I SAM-dependent methyltransferase [bacterium]|jgi:ubiquinone/menaquinone biosynthesis C-methylase UbiE|nr:class I SAM-dependent methyltransferase [bacterium]
MSGKKTINTVNSNGGNNPGADCRGGDRDAIIRKTRDDYNRIAASFAGTREIIWPEMDRLKPLLRHGQVIMDWGCGNGRLLEIFEGKTITYYGLDQSEKLIKIARERLHDVTSTKKQVSFICTAEEEQSFPDHFFDLVFMIASLHHLPDSASRTGLLAKMYRQIKPGGRLIIMVWNLFSNWAENKIRRHSWKRIGEHDFLIPWKNSDRTVVCERYYHRFSMSEMRDLLEKTGFDLETLEYSGTGDSTVGPEEGRNLIAVAVKR